MQDTQPTHSYELLKVYYTVGVKRKYLPGFKKYLVFGHKTEDFPNASRLVLSCADGSIDTVPNVAFRQIRVYPDYAEAIQNQKRVKAGKDVQPAQELPQPEPVLSEESYAVPEGQRGTL